jgi:hypothetical protein
MTPKQRITAAFKNKKPDIVPVSPELWDVIPLRVSGRPFWEVGGTSFSKIPLWKAQLDAYEFFGCESWIPVEPGPSSRQINMITSDSYFKNPGLIVTEVYYKTSKGAMHEVKHSVFDYDMWALERPVKNLFEDMPKFEEYFFGDPEDLDYSLIEAAFVKTGESGICEGIIGNTFFEFLAMIREGGAVQVILDLNDYPDFFIPIRDRYISYLSAIAEQIILQTSVEGVFLNCGTSSLDTVSPELFKKWDLPLLQSIGRITAQYDRIFHYHLHGTGRAILEDIVASGVNMICPLESRPRGDFDLAEVKNRFGDKLALKGNIDPFFPLRDGSELDIENAVVECIKAAGSDGGFTLATGDGVLKDTPFKNIFAMVEAGRKHGKY